MSEQLWRLLGDISLTQALLGFIIYTILYTIAVIKIINKFFHKESILYKNLNRPIKVFCPTDKNMEMEVKLLRRSNLFNIENPTNAFSDIHNIDKHCLIIVGYSSSVKNFEAFIEEAMQKELPILVYAFGNGRAVPDSTLSTLNKYPRFALSISPLRLASDVYTTLSTYPYEK